MALAFETPGQTTDKAYQNAPAQKPNARQRLFEKAL